MSAEHPITSPQGPAPMGPAPMGPAPMGEEPCPGEPLPPWVVVGGNFYGHRDWTIQSIVGQWIEVVEKRSPSGQPNKAWIYLPTGVVYGSTTLLRRSEHGLPVASR